MMTFKPENLKQKERYFIQKNIDVVSEEIYNIVNVFGKRHEQIQFDIKRSALLVLDMQNYFLSENSHAFIPSSEAIIDNVNTLIEKFEEEGRPIICSRHVDSEQNRMMRKWWNGMIKREDEFSEISEKISFKEAMVIEKNYYDLFKYTEVSEHLKEKGVVSVVVTGVMTHLCCETTARSAFMNGFEVFFPIDATATYNSLFHLSTFINLSHGFVIPALTRKITDNDGK